MQTRSMHRWLWVGGTMSLPLLVVLLAVGTAMGSPRYKKGSDVQVKAAAKRATKVEKKAGAAPSRPKLMAEQFRHATAAKVAKLTDRAISTLKRLIKVTDDKDPEKPDFFFRLAEHFREKKVQFMFRARELDEKVYRTRSAARKGQIKRQQKAYEKAEQQWMIQAIKMYLHIATRPEYEKFNRMDEVLFNVADMLNQANRRDKARIFFAKLIRNFPQSKYIPDAYLSFAEFYFNEGEIVKALKLYEQVGKFPNSPIYGYAVYKQGWCWLNLKDPHRALEMFVKVIKNAGRWGGTKKSKIVLVKEAKKDSVRAYSHVGSPEKAWHFFQRIGGSYAMKMLEGLAVIYYDQGKFIESMQTYRKLIALNPKSKELCNWQYAIMKATLSGKDKRQQVVESKRLAAVYGALKRRGGIRKTALAECRSNASGVLRELATTWHREAQKTMNMDTYALAQYLYKEYIDHFPNEKDAYVMSFYYAELLYKLEKWKPAAEAYTKVVKMKPRGKHLKEAAYAAVVSWKNALNVEDETKSVSLKQPRRKGKKGKALEEVDIKPKPIPDNQRKMIAAFETYIRYVPDAPELVPIMYRKARIYYEHNYYNKAIEMFARISTKHSNHELAVYAANLLLDSLNLLKKYGELNQWVNRYMKDPKLAQGEFLSQLRTLKRGAQRKEAEHLQKSGRYKECGEKYALIANEYQEDERWAEVLYNAALCFEAAKLIGQAISIRNTLIKIKPNHPLSHKAMYMIGENYHALAWYSRAAEYYEKFAKKFPGEKEAPKALQNAIVFRMGRAEYDMAIDNAKRFARSYGTRPKYRNQTAAVMFSLGAVYEGRKDWGRVVKHYNDYLRKWGRHGGIDRQVRANVKIATVLWEQSCPVDDINGACIKIKRVRSKRKLKKKKRRRGKKRRRKSIEVKQQCGPETKMKVTVITRKKAKARKAQRHFSKALTLYKRAAGGRGVKGEDKAEREKRTNEMKYAAAAARFYKAEAELEKFLDVKFPKSLDFTSKNKKKAAKSKKEFAKYLENKSRRLESTRKMYQDVIMLRQAHWAIAASARIGQLFQNFADALFTAPIPKPPLDEFFKQLAKKGVRRHQVPKDIQEEFVLNFVDTYCDTLEDKATPLEDKAVQGLATCLGKSTELSWYNEWSRLCERELNQIKPAEYPIASEIRAKPRYVTFRADRANAIQELK